MNHFPNRPLALIIRHQRENLKKCSLSGLEKREDLRFYTYPVKEALPLERVYLLSFEGEPLTAKEREGVPLFIDATWHLAKKMEKNICGLEKLERRSLPSHFRTAYPRRQEGCLEPERGLATVEALFIAYLILGHSVEGLLDHYYWKERFLELNGVVCTP